MARILAAAVNCENPAEDGSPCGECARCISIASDSSMDVIEIDAASNNKVENMRTLVEGVSYPPTEGKYKVYIIDEAHMITTDAFNALLKTLEEPPSYVIFILATTDVHKVPVTILSRCQRYDFKRISIDTIMDRMRELNGRDGHDVEEKGLLYIARRADGSMRDALSLLDQCISFFPQGTVTHDQVLDVLGAVDTEEFSNMLRMIHAQDVGGVMHRVENVVMSGRDLYQFTSDLIWYLRNLMLLKAAEDMEDTLNISSDNLKRLKEEADIFDVNVLIRYIHILSDLCNEMRGSSQKRALLEVSLIRIMKPQSDDDFTAIVDRLLVLEQQVQTGVVVSAEAGTAIGETKEDGPGDPAGVRRQSFPEAVEEDIKKAASMWERIVNDADPMTRSLLRMAYVTVSEDGRKLMLIFDEADKTQATAYKQLSQDRSREEVAHLVAEHVGAEVSIELHLNSSILDRAHMFEDAVTRFANAAGMEIEEEDF